MSTINPETLAAWTPAKRVPTKFGDRLLRKAQPTEQLRAAFGSSKQPGPSYHELKALGIGWSKEQSGEWIFAWWGQLPKETVEHEKAMVEASRATDADVDIPKPDGLNYMPFQKAGIHFAINALKTRPGMLFGDEMGLGKTIQLIGILNSMPDIKKVLIFCPASLKLNWARELRKWLVRPMTVGVGSTKCLPSTDILILNYDIAAALRRRLEAVQWDLIACDEVHYLKNKSAQRTKAIFGYDPRRKEIAAGEVQTEPLPSRMRVGMSGTLVVNKPTELFPILHWADPKEWDSFWRFAKRYCGMQSNGWGTTFDGATNLDELQHRLRSTCMVRRLKKEVLTELPAKRRQVIELPENGASDVIAQEREVNERWETEIANLRARVELAKASEDNAGYEAAVEVLGKACKVAFDECAKASHEVALAKVPYVVPHVEDAAQEGKIILFAHHSDVIDKYLAAFKDLGVLQIDGRVPVHHRQGIVDQFQNDPSKRVIVCGIHAAGVGLTLTASSHVIFGELDWVPANMMQAEDRAHRIGQQDSVLVQHLVMEGSIDVRKANALVRKMDIVDRALDRKTERQYPEYVAPQRPVEPQDEREEKAERFGGESVKVRKQDYEAEAAAVTREQTEAVLQGLKMLAGMCDGARELDDCGFSKVDVAIGHSLAGQSWLSPRQTVLGKQLCRKYRRQLPDAILEAAGVTTRERKDEHATQEQAD